MVILCIKKAKKSFNLLIYLIRLETGLFKWKPDYTSSVGYFEDAGKLINCLV